MSTKDEKEEEGRTCPHSSDHWEGWKTHQSEDACPQDYEIIECEPEKSNNLISIGGLAGWDEQVAPILRSRTWREFREDQLDALLTEKKNRRKKKTRTPVQQNKETGLSDRQRKIERLDRDPGHWRGLT